MKRHRAVERLADAAERSRRCFQGTTEAECAAMRRRVRAGELVTPYRALYARAGYWGGLNGTERVLHVIRALAVRYPQWTFGGSSAAAVWELEHPWSLHDDGVVYIVGDGGSAMHTHARLRRSFVPTEDMRKVTVRNGVRVASVARTLVDCGLRHRFVDVLPMFDSALRRRLVTVDEVVAICDRTQADCGHVLRLLHYASPLSENGGESLCRATIIEEGFKAPQLQHEFVDPGDARIRHRADFVWHTSDGRIVVLEFDGQGKYVDPTMTQGKSVRSVVSEEREREAVLRRAGVTQIIRTDFKEVAARLPLTAKLVDAGVPLAGGMLLWNEVPSGRWA
nr:CTP synthase [Bifidobacterium phasiani]